MATVDLVAGIAILCLGIFVLLTMTMSKSGDFLHSYPEIVRVRYLFEADGKNKEDPKLNLERDVFGISFSLLVASLLVTVLYGVVAKKYTSVSSENKLLAVFKEAVAQEIDKTKK
tara:strand:+ start:2601 stop:2945 length:345 start_codon:yes stop_codon:yes gene_type:complete